MARNNRIYTSHDPYLAKGRSTFDPRPYYELNGHNRCPRCGTGAVCRDRNDKFCLNCGARDSYSLGDEIDPAELAHLIYSRPPRVERVQHYQPY